MPHTMQSRVLTVAAMVRADEWLRQRCRDFVVPTDKADDPRYQPPVQVATADFTEAVIEARQQPQPFDAAKTERSGRRAREAADRLLREMDDFVRTHERKSH